MKSYTIIFLILLFCCSSLLAQQEIFLLYPEPGMEYRYEIKKRSYVHNDKFEKLDELIKVKTLRIICSEEKPEQKTLTVDIIHNSVGKPDSTITKYKDYRYPEFKDGFYNTRYPDFYEELLCQIEFKYGFNSETSTVEFQNREDVLLDVRRILNEKGYGMDEINERTSLFNKEAIPELTKMLQSIFQVKQNPTGDFPPKQTEYDSKFEIRDDILKVTNKKWDVEPGVYLGNYFINQKEKYLLDYHVIQIDSLKRPLKTKMGNYSFSALENRTRLVQKNAIHQNRFIISGKIENPVVKLVTLAVLKKAYGTEMHLETVPLDENNSFSIDTELEHPGIVYLQFGKTNHFDKRNVLSFYAEPGNEIHFNATGDSFPWKMEITGDNAGPSKLINDFMMSRKAFEQKIDWNTVQDYRHKIRFDYFLKTFYEFEDFAETYRDEMNEESFNAVTNELTAAFLCSFYSYLSQKHFNYYVKGVGIFTSPGMDEVDIPELENIVNAYNIHKIYNPYGIHSRQLVDYYLRHQFREMRRVQEVKFPNYRIAGRDVEFAFNSDISQRVELARSVLTGHLLYSQLVNIFLSEIRKEEKYLIQDKDYTFKKVDEYLDLMTRVVNDEKFINEIKEIRTRNLKWQSGDYVPEIKCFNLKGEEKYFKDFLGDKPTVFYISYQWDRERYYWDKLAEDNPELNVVMVMSGNNFEEWTDYMERATPVAKQLLMINFKQKLSDIFLKNNRHYIAYDNTGKLIGIKDSADEIISVAQESLKVKKKELNKSQLQLIIIVLVFILTTLIIGLILWKWRVRQRFRKEEQNRKLRELELTAIRSQMNPHFLFNSLNSVQNLVQQKKGREAHLYLADFAGLIRKVLNNSEKEEVSLAEELEMIKQYLNLEKLRFDFELDVKVDEEIDAHNTLVPSMLLQPFVENAVIHGLQNKPENRKLNIEVTKCLAVKNRLAHESANCIKITIEDNGIGRQAAKEITKAKNGKGTKLMKERLEILQDKQGEKYGLTIADLEVGTRVEILIPEES